ncbi:unnamed protein product [Rodentolepis nana]|uniref:Uncharacterized protein n=1 Tax=Rodentolepis nana TaxID=102285 RepID=A0A0R3TJV4_RODNA|nr:unnamed protein product [Rodentolepis nana]
MKDGWRKREPLVLLQQKRPLREWELNTGLPLDRRRYSPLYYRGEHSTVLPHWSSTTYPIPPANYHPPPSTFQLILSLSTLPSSFPFLPCRRRKELLPSTRGPSACEADMKATTPRTSPSLESEARGPFVLG